VRALQFGLGIKALGYNIYLAGVPGTGKATAATEYLRAAAQREATPSDWVYVHNFRDPYQPSALRLAPGMGRKFADDVRRLIEQIQVELPKAFESAPYTEQRGEIAERLSDRRRELLSRLTGQAKERDMAIQATPAGFVIVPVREDKPLSEDEIEGMDETARADLVRRRDEVEAELKAFLNDMRMAEKLAAAEIGTLDREVAVFAIGHMVDELIGKYGDIDGATSYLRALEEDVIDKQGLFRGSAPDEDEGKPRQEMRDAYGRDVRFRRYEVNVMVDNGDLDGAPVIVELNPTFTNLFGKIEKEAQYGNLTTDFTLIRAGALHRANGGYLVVPAREVLTNLFTYETLKLAARSHEIGIEEVAERLGVTTTKSLRPEPIPLNLKLVMIGDAYLHFLLHTYDPDFGELFKVKAEFGMSMERSRANVADYAALVCTICQKEGLRHLEAAAVAELIDHGARMAGDQQKLTTEFAGIADLIREADYWAGTAGAELIAREHVLRAIEERHYRSNLLEERLREMVAQGVLLIDTAGARTGQVNGLSVYSMGDLSFGTATRITATVGLGRAGVLDIEREARLGGPIHTKGVLILGGLMTERYAKDIPLSLSARLVFEQSYGMVEGDSASLAETCALLSALSGLPIRQSLAITGSIDQKGQVQPIGGVNEKIEGFFATCRLTAPNRGEDGHGILDGSNGVLIPSSNVRHLMLHRDVVAAAKAEQFHIWAVATLDEALELLTGVPAGVRGEDGKFPAGTVNALVVARLADLAEGMVRFGSSGVTTVLRSEAATTAGDPQPPQPPPVAIE
jgi:lon-related putative ATP-dependent protease